jgi:hypothetical protein
MVTIADAWIQASNVFSTWTAFASAFQDVSKFGVVLETVLASDSEDGPVIKRKGITFDGKLVLMLVLPIRYANLKASAQVYRQM